MGKELDGYLYPIKKYSLGSLVQTQIIKRKADIGIIIDRSVDGRENHWYMVKSIYTDKEYLTYPHEITLLSGEVEE